MLSRSPRTRSRACFTTSLAFALLVGISSGAGASPLGGYWLSLDARGTAGAKVQAASELAGDGERVFTDDVGTELPGEPVARVESVQDALAWVARWSFDGAFLGWPEDPNELRLAPAPEPSGTLSRQFELRLRALVVSGARSDDGVRPIHWPSDQAQVLPVDLPWIPAALVPERAPLFAAPSPRLPPLRERSGEVLRSGGLYLLGMLDRCEGHGPERRCLRWAQVVAREGGAFTPGYLPAFHVAAVDGWIRPAGSDLPRAQLLPVEWTPSKSSFLLIARTPDGELHQLRIELDSAAAGFPRVDLQIQHNSAKISGEGQPPLMLELAATLDYAGGSPAAESGSDSAAELESGSASSGSD